VRWNVLLLAIGLTLSLPALAGGEHPNKSSSNGSLDDYVRRAQLMEASRSSTSPGSLWRDEGRMASLSSDYKAAHIGDLVTILVIQDVQSQNTGNVSTDRSLNASSGIDALAGRVKVGGVQEILTLRSSQTLQGKAQASSSSRLRTALAGRVAAVLPNGVLVVEADRDILMNNERQTVRLRGLVRPGDIGPDNTVASNAIGNLELELRGRGVISDGTRPPNPVVRFILRIVGF